MDKNKKPAVVFVFRKILPADISLCPSHIKLMATAITKMYFGSPNLQHDKTYKRYTTGTGNGMVFLPQIFHSNFFALFTEIMILWGKDIHISTHNN